ncbi:hypothetical protein Tco_0826342 [Tanacetum coccineum]
MLKHPYRPSRLRLNQTTLLHLTGLFQRIDPNEQRDPRKIEDEDESKMKSDRNFFHPEQLQEQTQRAILQYKQRAKFSFHDTIAAQKENSLLNKDQKLYGNQPLTKNQGSRKTNDDRGELHTLSDDTGVIIHMLVEKKYPLRKEVLMQMLKLKLEFEEENTMALELIKFVKKILAELESEE